MISVLHLARIDSDSMAREREWHVSHVSEAATLQCLLDCANFAAAFVLEHGLPFLPQGTSKATYRRDVGAAECCYHGDVNQQSENGQG